MLVHKPIETNSTKTGTIDDVDWLTFIAHVYREARLARNPIGVAGCFRGPIHDRLFAVKQPQYNGPESNFRRISRLLRACSGGRAQDD